MGFKTEKSIFYHIPKTGGIWVKEAMRRSGIPYGRAVKNGVKNELRMYSEHKTPDGTLDSEKEGLFSFCFVRHPVDWYKSYWAFRLKGGSAQLRNPLDWYCWDNIFEKFVSNTLNYYRDGYVTRMYKLFVGEDLGKVDFIGRQENLVDDLVKALNLAGEEFDESVIRNLGLVNTSGRYVKNRLGLSKYTEERLIKTEKWVMEKFYA